MDTHCGRLEAGLLKLQEEEREVEQQTNVVLSDIHRAEGRLKQLRTNSTTVQVEMFAQPARRCWPTRDVCAAGMALLAHTHWVRAGGRRSAAAAAGGRPRPAGGKAAGVVRLVFCCSCGFFWDLGGEGNR
jgi:hypothetical protein